MIKRRYTLLLTIFVSCVLAVQQASAQAEPAPAGNEITPLKVGDKIPDALWDEYFPVVSAASEQPQLLSLGDFKDKLIILDFWATWCGSCIAAMPKLHDIAETFKDDVMVIPVTMEGEEKVRPFLNSNEKVKPLAVESIVKGETLREYFPHRMIPHMAVIQNGSVAAITSAEQLSKDAVAGLLAGKQTKLRTKADRLNFDRLEMLLRNNDVISESLLYGSSFFKHIEGTGKYVGLVSKPEYDRFFLINQRVIDFYFSVVDASLRNRIFFDVAELRRIYPGPEDLRDQVSWDEEYTFGYELLVPPGTPKEVRQEHARADFDRHFGLRSEMVEREIDCFVIRDRKNGASSSQKAAIAKEDQLVLSAEALLDYLNFQTARQDRKPIFINESTIDLTTELLVNRHNYDDVDSLQKYLAPYGLEVISATRTVDIILIKDQ